MHACDDMAAVEGMRPTWIDVDLGAFERNLDQVRTLLPPGSGLVAVLKADGYGHGAVELARRAEGRVAAVAVALLEEAVELRRAGVRLPILLLGPLKAAQIGIALEYDVTMGVAGPEQLRLVSEAAASRELAIHLKLDSGMGRMGILEAELADAAAVIRSAPRLRVAGLYTHFASADDDEVFTRTQIEAFDRMVEALRRAGVEAPLHHFANSAAALRGLVRPGDWARVGIALYGAPPVDEAVRLEPVMRWRTEIARLKRLPRGYAVGYGTTFRTSRESLVATLPVGYADGYDRGLSNRGEVLVRGRRAPVVGRVSMDLVTVDVTAIEGVAVGDEVILMGRSGGEEITAQEIASRIDTITYEVFCGIGARVPRIYGGGDGMRVRSRFSR